MTNIQFRANFYIAQNNPAPEPIKAEKKPEDFKIEEKTQELIYENIPNIKGEPLLKEILSLGLVFTEDHANVVKREASETGYPQLCKGILLLSFDDQKRFKKIKPTAHGPLSIEEIALKFPEKIGKRKIWFIRDFEIYQKKEVQEKLKEVILKIWNEKNGVANPVKNFEEIIER